MNLERFGFILASSTLLALGTLHWAGVTGNLTESEPIGLYLKAPGSPVRGRMVQLRGLIKHIAGLPGDTVRVTPEGSYVNGKLWPNSALPSNTNGYRPFPFGTYTLQPGQYWVLGQSADSWDSRYLGPVPWDAIAFNIAPLWTTSGVTQPLEQYFCLHFANKSGANPMALLKRKQEKTTTISVRVPMSVKEHMNTLRQLADTKGFDLTASLTDAVIKWTKQVHEELAAHTPAASSVSPSTPRNGADAE